MLPRIRASSIHASTYVRHTGRLVVVKLVEEGVGQVWMPAVVVEEWRTQQLDHLRKDLKKADEALRDIVRGGLLQEHDSSELLSAAAAAVEIATNNAENLSTEALDNLVDQVQAKTIPIADDHGAKVMGAYFRGTPPFSGVRI